LSAGTDSVFIAESPKTAEAAAAGISAFLKMSGAQRQVLLINPRSPEPEEYLSQVLPVMEHIISQKNEPAVIVACADTVRGFFIPSPEEVIRESVTLKTGMTFSMEQLIRKFSLMGYERTKYTELKGEMSQRGCIIDVFPANREHPLRIEFFGDRVESLRFFSPIDQASREQIASAAVFSRKPLSMDRSLDSFLLSGNLVFCQAEESELPPEAADKARSVIFFSPYDGQEKPEAASFSFEVSPSDLLIPVIPHQTVKNTMKEALRNIPPEVRILLSAQDDYSLKDLKEGFPAVLNPVSFFVSSLAHGFYWKDAGILFLTFDDIYKKYGPAKIKAASSTARIFENITDTLKKGDLVVHMNYGIGRFAGTTRLKRSRDAAEHIVVEYAEGARLFVPKEHFFMLHKYIGLQQKAPPLDSLHSQKWSQKKKKVQKDLFDYASEILRLDAERNISTGFSFRKNPEWVSEFENSFIYEDTPDQKKVTREVYEDMENEKPMDRLILGDVGYGKTEIAMRAAFKAAVNARQTAVLVPTTILAEQHGHTFRERMGGFPVRIEVMSRFQPEEKQKAILSDLKKGLVDILIGTHRLLQPDVEFKDIGLLIIDEEQKFGVKQKNILKTMRRSVDILTLSATPIPRTLYLSLMGMRNISLIQTPPLDRKPIKPIVTHADKDVIRQAVEKEMQRKGQTYIIHNKIETIFGVAGWIQNIIPKARIAVAHGRMDRAALKDVMDRFYSGDIDVLVSTIIIQSGIDIQNVNTMIIHNADMFGLADLYQLRGRIGRSDRMAYAYFLISRERSGDSTVKERIQAIKEFSSAGGHFRVALKDLEIRGAGNILGTNQSGHIAIIGFDLYCKLLDDAINTLKGSEVVPLFDVSVEVGIQAFIPTDYIRDFMERFHFYKRAYSVNREEDIETIKSEMKDRYGPFNREISLFLAMAGLKWMARSRLVSRVYLKNRIAYCYRNSQVVDKFELPEEIQKDNELILGFIIERLKFLKK
jgi:transcription-repair coupling factor (superfamily II helicase)